MTALARRTSAAVYARIHFFVCLLRTFMHRITEWRALHAGDDTLSVAMTFESRHRCSPFTTLWCQWEICVGVCENARSMCVRSVCGGFVRNARMNPGYRIFWCFFFQCRTMFSLFEILSLYSVYFGVFICLSSAGACCWHKLSGVLFPGIRRVTYICGHHCGTYAMSVYRPRCHRFFFSVGSKFFWLLLIIPFVAFFLMNCSFSSWEKIQHAFHLWNVKISGE